MTLTAEDINDPSWDKRVERPKLFFCDACELWIKGIKPALMTEHLQYCKKCVNKLKELLKDGKKEDTGTER